eukprot:scaffold12845_cov87-Cyclotella_meneghiniana.AAC.3
MVDFVFIVVSLLMLWNKLTTVTSVLADLPNVYSLNRSPALTLRNPMNLPQGDGLRDDDVDRFVMLTMDCVTAMSIGS